MCYGSVLFLQEYGGIWLEQNVRVFDRKFLPSHVLVLCFCIVLSSIQYEKIKKNLLSG